MEVSAEKYLNVALEDDDTPYGGIGFIKLGSRKPRSL